MGDLPGEVVKVTQCSVCQHCCPSECVERGGVECGWVEISVLAGVGGVTPSQHQQVEQPQEDAQRAETGVPVQLEGGEEVGVTVTCHLQSGTRRH